MAQLRLVSLCCFLIFASLPLCANLAFAEPNQLSGIQQIPNATPTVRFVAVPVSGKAQQKLSNRLFKAITTPLYKQYSHIAFKAYTQAALQAGIQQAAVMTSKAVIAGGKAVQASHVLFFSVHPSKKDISKSKKKVGQQPLVLQLQIFACSSGEALLNKNYAMHNNKLSSKTIESLLKDIHQAFTKQPVVALPVASSLAVASTIAPATPLAGNDLISGNTAIIAANSNSISPNATLAAVAVDRAASLKNELKIQPAKRRADHRLGATAQLGVQMYQRVVAITASSGISAPGYNNQPGTQVPWSNRQVLHLDLFPLAFTGIGRFYEGFGLYLDGMAGFSSTTDTQNASSTSFIWGLGGGLQYRHVFWNAENAIEGSLRLGYHRYDFPLGKTVAFISTAYSTLPLQLQLVFPLGIPQLVLVADGSLLLLTKSSGMQAFLGKQQGTPLGFTAQAGLQGRLFKRHLLFGASFFYERYKLLFEGATSAPIVDINNQSYDDVSFSETLLGVNLQLSGSF